MDSRFVPFTDIGTAIDYYYDKPAAFFQDILFMDPDEWQEDVLDDLARYPKVSVRSGQGVGKTALEAGAIIWFLTCRPYAKVIATAPTMQQLYDVLWAEVAKWLNQSLIKDLLKWTKTKIYMVGDEERWFATAKTATKPENMQGFHEDHMLIVVDEASGVADPIMEAILGTLSGFDNKLLMCGNPNKLEGVFYDSHNVDRDKYKTHKVSSFDSTRTSKDNIEMLLSKYGKESDVAKVRIYGDFPKGALDSLINMETVELAIESTILQSDIDKAQIFHIGVDVARFGDDSTILFPRIDNRAMEYNKYHKQDTMETAGNVLMLAKDLMTKHPNLKKGVIKVDDTGVGGGVTDRLKEVVKEEHLPYEIIPVNNGSSATDDYYFNLGTQLWGHLKEMLEENMTNNLQDKEVILQLPNDPVLIKQLSNRKYKITSRGKIHLESKDDMKKRGVGSPDVADAAVLAFYEPFKPEPINVKKTIDTFKKLGLGR